MQKHSKALTAYQKALELDPSNAEALEGYRACSTQLNSNPEEVGSITLFSKLSSFSQQPSAFQAGHLCIIEGF